MCVGVYVYECVCVLVCMCVTVFESTCSVDIACCGLCVKSAFFLFFSPGEMCVCVCVRERERERKTESVRVSVFESA